MTHRSAVRRVALRKRALAGSQDGFTLIEALIAMILFLLVAAALAGVLVSAINARGVARQRTVAEQAATEQVESIREYDYDDVGFVGGNPSGEIPTSEANKTVTISGITLNIVTQIQYVADPTPTSYATSANYKKVTVTVRRASDSKLLTREVTYIAPPARAPLGGIGNAIINVQVVDYGSATPVEGATVSLATGPSAPRSDVTDVTGLVTFPALTPNPVSGPTAYYDITASLSGYVTLADDVPPGPAAHVQVAPGQTINTAVRIYRPAEITVHVDRADGAQYPGTGTVTVSSSRGSETFAYTGSDLVIDEVNGEPIVPSLDYTVSGQFGGLTPMPVTQYVPDDYPTDLTSSFTLALPDYGTLGVTVTQAGVAASGASVNVTGGPADIDVTGATDANGFVSFDLPAGSGYTVTASHLGQSASATADIAPDSTTSVALDLAPPVGSIVATVTWAGLPVAGKTVQLTGGPTGVSLSGTTDVLGQVTFINLPGGGGYVVTADPTPGFNIVQGGVSVSPPSATSVSLALPTATLTVNVKRSGVNQSGATVRVTGGPMGVDYSPGTYIGSGNYTFTVPVGSGYTVKAWKCSVSNPKSGQTTGVSVPSGGATVNISFSLNTCPLP